MRVVDTMEMKALDARASERDGDVELMRRAGVAIAALIPQLTTGRKITGVAGPGNNGGDVFAALAELDGTYERIVVEIAAPQPSAARRDARERAVRSGVEVAGGDGAAALDAADLILDGLLGVGAHLPLAPAIAVHTRRLNAHHNVLAIDVPTGIDATTGAADEDAVRAHATIALGALKLGFFSDEGRRYVGQLWFDGIGIDASGDAENAGVGTLTQDEAARLLPVRPPGADKRAAGAPLIIAGSEQFPGAAILCTRAAARAGAGYVTVAAPASAAGALRAHLVEQVAVTFDDRDPQRAIETILGLTNHCTSIGIGPGLGLSDAMGTIVREVLTKSTLPMVADAGALFHLAKHLDILRDRPIVLTPHAGEFARLGGKGSVKPADRIARLRAFVRERRVVTLLKGETTLVDDGEHLYLNATGTNALATAGTGDVLTGMIATLLSQGLAPFEAASLGAFWHGRAGQSARSRRSVGVIAGDVIDSLADAVPQRSTRRPVRIF